MMPSQSTNVFVSYSHADASLVAPVVQLLRANKSLVFQDIDRIQPGKRWRSEIARALAESHLVVVFWCDHASRSNEVAKEWKAAIEQEKDLLPLLLDATPLPPELGEFQWIDFRGTVGANHSSIAPMADNVETGAPQQLPPSPPPRSAPIKSGRWFSLAGFAAVLALGLFTWTSLKAPQEPIIVKPLPTPLPPGPPNAMFDFSSILLLLAVFFAITACLVWLLRRPPKRGRPSEEVGPQREVRIERAGPHPGEIERRIASELEAEILRRTASRRDGEA
jgi:hypothetical protein